MNKKLKQLKFRSCHRGMREMDILMGGFFEMFQKDFSEQEIDEIEKYIIPLSDNDLYNCFTNRVVWPKNINNNLQIKLEVYSKERGLKNS